MPDETITFFYRAYDKRYGFLSQWYISPFLDEKGVLYNCAEQYMMAEKARLFCDVESEKKILLEQNPMKQKQLGRNVEGFNQKMWEKQRYSIVKKGNRFKFQQNPNLMRRLLQTSGRIAEASPSDKIWGIGMAQSSSGVWDPYNWKGENLLGNILTSLRDEFRTQVD